MDSRLTARRSDKWTHYPPDVLPAWVAEMDFALAPPVHDALRRAIDLGDLGYIGNVDALLSAFTGFMERRLGWTPGPTALVCDVMVGIQEIVRRVSAPGEAVVLTPPCYPPYFAEIPRELVEVPLLEDFSLDFDGLDRAFAAGAKALVLCHPHNPTGRVAPVAELQRLASLADAWGVHVIADEIHGPLHFGEFTTWAQVSEHGSVLTSASKAFNLPALKLAFVVGSVAETLPEDLRDHAGLLGVLAAEAAFREGDVWLDETIATIRANHERVRDGLPDGVRVAYPPEAGYLTWLDCREAGLGDDPAEAFLERGRVALYPGLRFGAPGAGFARLNVGTTPELVDEALTRLARAR
jgi:cystathionine beta-lyase